MEDYVEPKYFGSNRLMEAVKVMEPLLEKKK